MMNRENANQAELLRICREITIELRQYPGARLFNEPVNPEQQSVPNYYKKVKNPQDLGTILDRLEHGEYTDIKLWEKDINLVWLNAELYNGKESYVSVIAHHMQRHFSKLKKRLEMKKISGWMKFLYFSREKLDRLLLSPPSNIGPIFPIHRQINSQEYAPFSNRELDCLIEASRFCFKPEDLMQISKILQTDTNFHIENDDMVINVDNMPPKTLHLLRNYFKKRLIQLGAEYPQ